MLVCNVAVYASTATKREVAKYLLMPSSARSGSSGGAGGANTGFQDALSFGSGLRETIKVGALLGGAACLLICIQLYIKHRKSPVETPLSKVFLMFFMGLALIALSFIPAPVQP